MYGRFKRTIPTPEKTNLIDTMKEVIVPNVEIPTPEKTNLIDTLYVGFTSKYLIPTPEKTNLIDTKIFKYQWSR